MKTQNSLELGKKQVQDFCNNIQVWFNGTAKNQKHLYEQIINTFAPAFKLVNGDGDVIDFTMLSQWLKQVYGQFPSRIVSLQKLEGYATSQHILVSYIEIQSTGEIQTIRQASAIFIIKDNKALWYHLIEKWID
ncbi:MULTISPECIES: hypothetical protein [unclassified Sphingobacterium]|jgi:hypothetical protein|uniref:hypothetical protein n=1 Tax=unclassified Sphingobacterium TaxID=2609468 RepID=UPI00143A1912|nr:hypothetical protein [Sphingobacterium sp. B16(2022)]NJI72171.1 hypothetical protein [Sphingobacterium sp. B16(2022)]